MVKPAATVTEKFHMEGVLVHRIGSQQGAVAPRKDRAERKVKAERKEKAGARRPG
jgi:hypothetical protein